MSEQTAPLPDLTICEREPIHIPNAIQSYGAFLAVDAETWLVSHASANLAAFLGLEAQDALGDALPEVLGPVADALRQAPDEPDKICLMRAAAPRPLHLRAFRSGPFVCIDIEPADKQPWRPAAASQLQPALDAFKHAASTQQLCELAVREMKRMTGYDRVMAYRFAADGHGEVIAELIEPGLEPYLGLHYPASDIPAQARALYVRQPVGMIADSAYQPVPLLCVAAQAGVPLDLTGSALRSVSPVHRQFMRNMGTAASLSVALIQGGALWGMLVCHHGTPHAAAPDLRDIAAIAGRAVSLVLSGLAQTEAHAWRLQSSEAVRDLAARLVPPLPLPEVLRDNAAGLLGLVNATGAIVQIEGLLLCLGQTPPQDAARAAMLELRAAAGGEVLAVDDLALRYPTLAACRESGSGALFLPLGRSGDTCVLWFRPELPRTVRWAGNPHQHVLIDPITETLHPRASFAVWQQIVHGHAAPWTEDDMLVARQLGLALADVLARRAEQAAARDARAQLELLDERRRSAEALAGSEELLRLATEAAGIACFEQDNVTGIIRWAAGSQTLLGFRPDQSRMPVSAWRALRHPEDAARIAAYRTRAAGLRNPNPQFECRIFRPDTGEMRLIEARLRAEYDGPGEPSRTIGAVRDITEQRAAEDNLRAVVQLGPGHLYRARITGAGLEVLSIHGNIAHLGSYASALQWVQDLLAAPERVAAIRAIEGTGQMVAEYAVVDAAAKPRWMRNAVRVTERTGNTLQLAGYLTDMTSEKTDQLNREQVTTLLTLGEMATGIAHEMNQPLSSISFAAQNALMRMTRQPVDLPGVSAKLHKIVEEASRTSKLVEHMRMFARNDRAAPGPIGWRAALRRALELLAPRLRGCRVLDLLPDDLPDVIGAPIPMEQTLINLIGNAVDACEDTVRDEPSVVEVRGAVEEGMVVLRVCDHAGGIPDDVLPHIFEPFFTTKPPGKGTGLGLSLTFGTVTAMGGTITARNEDGGAVFEIRLPAAG